MQSVRADCEGDVGPSIDHDPNLAPCLRCRFPRGRRDFGSESKQRGAFEIPLAQLHPIDAGPNGFRDSRRWIGPAEVAVDDEAQNGTVREAQKLAIPSMGLEADA